MLNTLFFWKDKAEAMEKNRAIGLAVQREITKLLKQPDGITD